MMVDALQAMQRQNAFNTIIINSFLCKIKLLLKALVSLEMQKDDVIFIYCSNENFYV